MKICGEVLQFMKDNNMAEFQTLKALFLYHSNKIEGSTFSYENLIKAIDKSVIEGNHSYEDVIETMNSTLVFDFIIDTINEPLTEIFIKECHSLLTKNTKVDLKYKQSGRYKIVDNELLNIDLKLTPALDVPYAICELLKTQDNIKTVYDTLIFHANFEKIHPFLDGNGRIGRFILLKQCIMKNLDIFMIDEKFEDEYKNALYVAQKNRDYKHINEVADRCISYMEEKLLKYDKVFSDIKNALYNV